MTTASEKLQYAREELEKLYSLLAEQAQRESRLVGTGYRPASDLSDTAHKVAVSFAQVAVLEELAAQEVK
jgi:hypothetical protein